MTRALLVVAAGDAAGTEIAVDGELTIGRTAEGDGRLGGDPELSRRHARIAARDGALVIEDLGSTNGTRVNGSRLVAPQPLAPGDVIRAGRTTLRVERVGDGAADGRPRGAGRKSPNGRAQQGDSTIAPEPPAPEAPTPAAPAAAHVLHAGHRLPVPPGGLSIGRGTDNDVVIEAELASRHHARITEAGDGGGYAVTDLGTLNGTLLNGERLRGASRPLRSGDAIAAGGEVLRFVTGEETRFGAVPAFARPAEVVRFTGERLTLGRDPANDVTLPDPNVSRLHAEVVTTDAGVELRDLGSRNGTRLDGRPVTRAPLATGAEIGIGPFRLVFDGERFLRRDDRGALRLDAEELTVTVRGKRILNRASISIEPGELLVVIGESGSGKSTLVKALAGVTRPSGGRVEVSGEPVAARLTDLGYVPQDEIVHRHLTVREALRYSARLRLPGDSTRADVDEAVRRVLDELSLAEHADTRIGSLSGGQRKRAGLAAELLNRPSLLFLDEPTTGLDPGLETRMMELFRDLARDGRRAVAVVTHATKNLALADRICVMGRGGEPAFHGSPAEALEFFGADDFDGIYAALEERPAVEWRRDFEARRPPPPRDGAAARPAAPRRAGRRSGRRRALPQASILARRYARLMVRDSRNLLILLGQVPVIALGIALLFKAGLFDRPRGRPAEAAQLLFLLTTTAIWIGSIDGSREIIKERSVAVREAAIGVRLGAYLLSKVVVLFALAVVQAALLAGLVFALRPLDEPAAGYALVLGVLVATSFVAVGMGLLISAAVDSEDQATSFIPLALIPQLLFAGAIVPVARMGEMVDAVSHAVFARWSFAAAGSAIDMNERLGADRTVAAASGYGTDFFTPSPAAGFGVLGAFLALFLAAAAVRVRRALR